MTEISIRIHMMVTSAISSFISDLKNESGQDLIEYALLGGLIAAAIVAVFALGAYQIGATDLMSGIKGCIDFKPGSCTGGL